MSKNRPGRETQKPKQNKPKLIPPPKTDPRFYQLADTLIRENVADAQKLRDETPSLLTLRNGLGETVLHFLAVENEQNGIAWLFERGADINTRSDFNDTPLMNAVRLNYADLCRFLLDNGARMDFANTIDETALTYAAQAAYDGKPALLSLLLERATPTDLDFTVDLLRADAYARAKMDEILTWAAPDVVSLLKNHGFASAETC